MEIAKSDAHTFHIPVMGTGFTIDTPLRVAKYGISSVISLVDDVLIEQMRKFHSERLGIKYEPITNDDEDYRACRIKAYLDFANTVITKQVRDLKASHFKPGSEITHYYEMLPDCSIKETYLKMLKSKDLQEKSKLQDELRNNISPGKIDVNIMTKLDNDKYLNGEKISPEFSDGLSALRGFATSTLDSSVVFSAGMNPRLYNYAAQFDDFFPDAKGKFKKKIIIKVSDYRSALIQGKFLAKKGLWVSEYRIESGLNCGGHAFATKGILLGPILEEFKSKKPELIEEIGSIYSKSLEKLGRPSLKPTNLRITAQGGIGTASENNMLLKYYELDSTGWGTPFLLVPEVTSVDSETLRKLVDAKEQKKDVYLSQSSPMGVSLWNLRNSASEEIRQKRIEENKPGSPCIKGHLAFSNEFTNYPLCIASRAYQRRKLESLEKENLSEKELEEAKQKVLEKSCLCNDLCGGALIKYGINTNVTPAICCGPNIVNFSKVSTLEEMVNHIYGRISSLVKPNRPHIFINEIGLYLEYLRQEIKKGVNLPKYFEEFRDNLLEGIEYYRERAAKLAEEQQEKFLNDLKAAKEELENMFISINGTKSLAT